MVWGCLCFEGIGTLTPVDGIIDSRKYINIIEDNLWPVIARHFGHDEYTFMDNNALVHRARIVKTYMENNNVNTTDGPAQSPELNII